MGTGLFAQSGRISTEPRTALIIGNSRYEYFGSLENPANDAHDVGRALEELGFDVTTLLDATERDMIRAVRDFGDSLTSNQGIGLFFYAGHGIEADGRNYLIPVDADIQAEDEVAYSSIELDLVLSKMETARNPTNIIILDACRDNPLPASARSTGNRGLTVVEAPTGSLIVYATQPGNTAADGVGRNSPFTASFLDHVDSPNVDIELMFRNVRSGVMQATANQQVPWTNSSLTRSVLLNPSTNEVENLAPPGGNDSGSAGDRTGGPTVTVTPEREPRLTVVAEYGTLVVDTLSAGDIYLNGELLGALAGNARATLSDVEAGRHVLEVDYGDEVETREVELAGGETLSVRFTWEDEPADGIDGRSGTRVDESPIETPMDDGPLTIGSSVRSSLDASDQGYPGRGRIEWHRLRVNAGETASIFLSSNDFDTYLVVRYPDGREVTNDDSDGTDSQVVIMADESGSLEVGATSYGDGSYGDYRLEVRRATVEALTPGRVATGTYNGERVVYSLEGRRGDSYEISLSSDDFDTILEIDGPGGRSLYNDDHGAGLNSFLQLDFDRSGSALVSVRGYSTGRFRLEVAAEGAGIDRAGTDRVARSSAVTTLAPGDSVSGQIGSTSPRSDAGSYEPFRFEASSGDRFIVTQESDDFDSYLRVLSPNGDVYEDDDGAGNLNSRVEFTAPASGSYEVRVGSYYGESVGRFTVTLERLSGGGRSSESGRSSGSSGSSGARGAVIYSQQGALTASDLVADDGTYYDILEFEIPSSGSVVIDVLSSDFDAYAILFDGEGNNIESNDDGGEGTNPRFERRLTRGWYSLIVNSYFEGETGSYEVTVTEAR